MATPRSTPNSALNGGSGTTSTTPAPTNPPNNSTAQSLLPLVAAVAQSTANSVEQVLDQHFTALLRQQQQLVSAVQQLARPQAAVSLPSSSSPPTGPPSSTLAGGPPGSVTPQPQIPPAGSLRSIPLITSTPTTVNPSSLLAISGAENSGTVVPSRPLATPILATAELPGMTAPVVLASSTPPIPPKVVERIWKGEYVAMSELLPERLTEPPEGEIRREEKRRVTKWPIQTIATWSLGFSVYIGVMAMKHPERVPDLAAYMALIIQASRQFKGTPWQDYDTRFRMQVAAAKCSHLAVVDTSLWAITFANAEPREECRHCRSLDHESGDCTQEPTAESKGKEPVTK